MLPVTAADSDWPKRKPSLTPSAETPTRSSEAEGFSRRLCGTFRAILGRESTKAVSAPPVTERTDARIDRLGETLRQPLTSIRLLSEAMQENPELPIEQQAKMLGLIVEETQRLNRLIGQCLDLVAETNGANDRYSERDKRGVA